MIYQLLVALTIVAAASGKVFTEDPAQQKELWGKFKLDFQRKYESGEEESRRFKIFLDNLKRADELFEKDRKNGGSATFGVTRFSDLTLAEFHSQYLTADTLKNDPDLKVDTTERLTTTPTLVDWTGIYTTAIKDQGYCGCCWAFSAAEQVESDSMRTLKTNWILSSEQFCQCVTSCAGCNGGNTNTAFQYAKSHYIEQDSSYPYTSYSGFTGLCTYNSNQGVVSVTNYYATGGTSVADKETAMANYLQSTGPLSILVDAEAWSAYTGGIMSAATCGTTIDHAVQAVGVYPVDAASGGYWKIRNQWGASWGEAGFIRVAYGQNSCNLTTQPLYVTVAKK